MRKIVWMSLALLQMEGIWTGWLCASQCHYGHAMACLRAHGRLIYAWLQAGSSPICHCCSQGSQSCQQYLQEVTSDGIAKDEARDKTDCREGAGTRSVKFIIRDSAYLL